MSSANLTFSALGSHTLRGRIAEEIRQAIFNGSLPEGARIVERRLAEQFGASLTAVREAIVELETEGFITKRPNSTTHVTKLRRSDTHKIFEVRRILEAFAVQQAALHMTDEALAGIDKLYSELLATASKGDGKTYINRDFEWHRAVWQSSDNEYLANALRRVVVPLFALSAVHVIGRSAIELVRDACSHLPLLEALRSRDPEAAHEALRAALTSWEKNTEHYLFDKVPKSR